MKSSGVLGYALTRSSRFDLQLHMFCLWGWWMFRIWEDWKSLGSVDMKSDLYVVYDVHHTPDLDHGNPRTKKARRRPWLHRYVNKFRCTIGPTEALVSRKKSFPDLGRRSIHAISFSSRSRHCNLPWRSLEDSWSYSTLYSAWELRKKDI